MPYQISTKDDEIISVKFFGNTDYEESVSAREEALNINLDKNYFKILADWREPVLDQNVSMKNLDDFGNSWPMTSNSQSFVVAIVLSQANVDKNVRFATDFSRTVAAANGLISKTFWDLREALDWLKSM
ncbi:hypothetical protein [Aliikangiella sp. G2MR2-5]|uniref:hypothetical protein n=1 Tax=Aliikangiella sp. G2MR2-5 TaxID=2788943 RepID=UPI0018A9DC4F|nr:hypothetical protein [Aliikangiella sp. G2MR2-5]